MAGRKRAASTDYSRKQLISMMASLRGVITDLQQDLRNNYALIPDADSDIATNLTYSDKIVKRTAFDVAEEDLVEGAFDKSWDKEDTITITQKQYLDGDIEQLKELKKLYKTICICRNDDPEEVYCVISGRLDWMELPVVLRKFVDD